MIFRKKTIVIGAVAGAIAAATCMTAFADQITKDRAESIALSDAGVSRDSIAYIWTEYDRERGKTSYDVEFMTKDFLEYDYDIDAVSGSIIKSDREAEYEFFRAIPERDRKENVSLEQAKSIALRHAGKEADEVRIIKESTDRDDGLVSYDIEFYSTDDGNKFEYEISAYTGEVISFETDFNNRYSGSERGETKERITWDSARSLALSKAGVKESEVRGFELELDYDDGILVYEGSFNVGWTEYDFEINASTGSFVSWSVERDE
jgi:uncharacterized membrane protein YkoI